MNGRIDEEIYDEDLLDEQMRRAASTRRIIVLILGVILSVVIIGISIYAFINQKKTDGKIREAAKEYNEVLLRLYTEKTDVEEQLGELEDDLDESVKKYGSVVLLCTEPGRWILSEIKPYFDSYGFVGTVAVSSDAFPGDEGCLSVWELTELINDGWSVCVSASSVEEADSLNTRLEEIGIGRQTAVYMPGDAISDTDELSSHKITTVITHVRCDAEKVWNITAKGCCESGVSNVLKKTVNSSNGIVFTMGKTLTREAYGTETIASMCKVISTYVDDGTAWVMGPADAKDKHDELTSLYEKKNREKLEKESELKNRLSQIEEEILQYTTSGINS